MISGANTSYYDPRNVECLIGGIIPTDVAEGTMYAVSRNSDVNLPTVGVLGEVAVAVNRDKSGTFTISLKQTSETHTFFMAQVALVEAGNSPLFPIILKDKASGSVINSIAWIQTEPDLSLGQVVGQFDWVLGLADASKKMSAAQDIAMDAITSSVAI